MMEDFELWDVVENAAMVPDVMTNPVNHASYVKKNVKAKRIHLDTVKYRIIQYPSNKKNAYEMWESLSRLYMSSNLNMKMMLREKLRNKKMQKSDSVTSSLTEVTQVRDEPWESFVQGIVARENMPNWDSLWDDFMQEELTVRAGCSES